MSCAGHERDCFSSAKHFTRRATQDCTVRGQAISQGDRFMLLYQSANRDPDVFDDPDSFRLQRRPNKHIAFGYGPHMCIGQFVAKIELQCAINAILDLFPNVRLDPSKPKPKIEGAMLRGASSVSVIWD